MKRSKVGGYPQCVDQVHVGTGRWRGVLQFLQFLKDQRQLGHLAEVDEPTFDRIGQGDVQRDEVFHVDATGGRESSEGSK